MDMLEERNDDSSRVDDSYEGVSEALQALFGVLHIDIDIDVERDIKIIKEFGTYILKTQ